MRVRYVGASSTGVRVVHPDPAMPDANTVTSCPHGEDVELPDDVALAQLAAGGFEPADRAAKQALARHRAALAADNTDEPETAAGDVDEESPPAVDDPSTEEP